MSALRLTLNCRLDAFATLGWVEVDGPVVGFGDGVTVGAVDAVATGVGDWDTAADGAGDSDADGDEVLFWVVAK